MDYLWSEAISSGTKQAYNTGMRCFRTFIALNNISVDGSIPVVDENMLILFVAHCYSVLHLKYCTIKLGSTRCALDNTFSAHLGPLTNSHLVWV